jgi:hypothetical protein
MTNNKLRDYYNYEALRALVAFVMMMFLLAISLDVSYYNVQKFNLDSGLNLAASTGAEGLPNSQLARSLTLNVANSQGIPLEPYQVQIDRGNHWVQADMKAQYETMYLKYVGIKRIPIDGHALEF